MISKFISRFFSLPPNLCKSKSRIKGKIIRVAKHGICRNQLSNSANKVISTLQDAGFSAYVVGGAVRDLLLDLEPKDYDVATDAIPEQVHKLFRRSRIIGRRFRIVHVMFGNEIIEVATFRGGKVSDHSDSGRIMKDNNFGKQEEDAYRRDFTVNALLYDPSEEIIIDYLNGLEDLHKRRLVMIGNPDERYKEDPVRMLRAVRLSAKLNLKIAEKTAEPIKSLAYLLKKEPPARLFDELLKLLLCGHSYVCINQMQELGLTQGIFPLIDLILKKKNDNGFIEMALEVTDRRVIQGKTISVGFLLASLLWPDINRRWQIFQKKGEQTTHALLSAITEIEEENEKVFLIPRRYRASMRGIWSLQPRFENIVGNRPFRLLEQNSFAAAYDFIVLRAKIGEVSSDLINWWESFRLASYDERVELISTAKDTIEGFSVCQTRRRKRKKITKSKKINSNNDGMTQ